MDKKEISSLFSSNYDKYYKVSLFDKLGYIRKQCGVCNKFFWTIIEKNNCPDHENYTFIDNPPTKKRLDYVNTWKKIEDYFDSRGHSIVRRYPVVCRWREDLYYTIASIVDFQRVIRNKVIFELPSNPLVVPQMCLRFNDIENVGLSGRHYTSFCMIGQTCNADIPGGYWKDQCIELDHEMLTKVLGIPSEEITYVEDVWMGAGAFGYSLEYFVRGLELGNAVFTEFEGNENNYKQLKNKIIDMGAGLERLSWITMGTPTSYDCTFGSVINYLENTIGISSDTSFLSNYFKSISKRLNEFDNDMVLSDSIPKLKKSIANDLKISYNKLQNIISQYEAIYTIADHSRTLLFAISDGSLPSNVGGGYNLRILLRRILSIIDRFQWRIDLGNIIEEHIEYLKNMYPELSEHKDEVITIIKLESQRYANTKQRMNGIITNIKKDKINLSVDDLIRFYESDGITPDLLKESNVLDEIPSNFYVKLAQLHSENKKSNITENISGIDDLPSTKLLYYTDNKLQNFSAKVIKILNNKYIILDKTAFYPRGGGQEPDTGNIGNARVLDVIKQNDIVLHKVSDIKSIHEGDVKFCKINYIRRESITKHHTATHVLNASSRNTLGSWVWQNSAYKDENYGRLDITHHSALKRNEIEKIEEIANTAIMKNLSVNINEYKRGESEQKFSFRIYQGGVVPSNIVRIVNIDGFDIEACGGTHVSKTGELGIIKIIKSERIQDGVVRLEFVAGQKAINYISNQDKYIQSITHSLGSSKDKILDSFNRYFKDSEKLKTKIKIIQRKLSPIMAQYISSSAKQISPDGVKMYVDYDDELDDDYHIAMGMQSIQFDPFLLYISLILKDNGIRVVVFVGEKAIQYNFHAGKIARSFSNELGGSGGGDAKFGQGGGKHKHQIKQIITSAEKYVNNK